MTMSDFSILSEGLSKQYVVGGAEQSYDSFREMLTGAISSPIKKMRRLRGNVAEDNKFWALSDLNFQIKQGEVVGVIGHNGAGKSTLLKVLSRITSPTRGQVKIKGKVSSLLEVGTGFHPELTGRENIFLNGSILGMSKKQIAKQFDEIVEFSGVEKFIDTPVKRYSSGMYVRLAFSVAAHLETDVLMIDEVLAVGDQKFQQRCLGKLSDVSSQGRTVLFVSHNISAVAKLCDRVMVLDQGKLVYDGDVHKGISIYNGHLKSRPSISKDDIFGELHATVQFRKIYVNGQNFHQVDAIDAIQDIVISIEGEAQHEIEKYQGIMSIRKDGELLFSVYDSAELTTLKKGRFKSTFVVPKKLLFPGEYSCSFGGVSEDRSSWLWTKDIGFQIAHQWQEDYNSTSNLKGLFNVLSEGKREYLDQ